MTEIQIEGEHGVNCGPKRSQDVATTGIIGGGGEHISYMASWEQT